MTAIGRLSERFIEACWLVVPVLVATFLNPFSDQVFEPDKAALLRALIVLLIAAWLIRDLESGTPVSSGTSGGAGLGQEVRRVIGTLFDNPIAGLALLLLLIDIASTFTSISPRVSWWGSYERAQGTYTLLTYMGLFFVLLAVLRREDQLHRLITVLLFTSFPVALYAVLQRYGMSLLQFSQGGVESRVISTMGNAIFLAAYLAMVVPLTLWRILESTGARPRRPVRAAIAGGLYGGLLVLQLAAIVFTQSRGPILGLLVELFVFILLIALLRRQRRWAMAGVLLVAIAVVVLLALNIPGLPTESLRRLPYVARFGELAGSGAQTLRARALAWDTVLNTMRAEPTRMVLGYGPETMKSVLTRFMPAELWVLQGGGQYGTFDRAHNAVFDALYTRGLVGAALYLLLYGTIFYQALRWMGLARSQRETRGLLGLLVGGAVLGLFVLWLWRGDVALAAAVGLPFGMVAGLVLYLLGKTAGSTEVVSGSLPADEANANELHPFLMVALLAALVGHFVETQTGIAVVVTQTYFWLYTALLILLGTGRISEPEPTRRSMSQPAGRGRPRRSRRGRRQDDLAGAAVPADELGSVVAMALVAAVLLGTLSYAFVHGFGTPGTRGPALALIGVTWLFSGSIILLEHYWRASDTRSLDTDVLAYAVTSLIWSIPFAVYHRANAQTLDRLNTAYLVFVVWVLLTVVGIATALHWNEASPRPAGRSGRRILYPMIVLLALVLVWRADVTPIQADIHEKVGKTTMGAGLWDQAVPNLARAVVMRPWQEQYYIYLGGAYVEQARILSEPAMKDARMEQALQVLERGQALAPLDSDQPRQLGLTYRVWADWAPDEAARQQRLQQSVSYYLDAVELSPQNPNLRLDLAGAYFALGMNEEALAQYEHAVAIGAPSHLGRAYAGLGDIYLLRGQLTEAMEAYRHAMQAGQDRQEVLESRRRAVSNHPDDIQVHMALALAYAAAQRQGDALQELNAASGVASSDAERAEVEKLIAMVKK